MDMNLDLADHDDDLILMNKAQTKKVPFPPSSLVYIYNNNNNNNHHHESPQSPPYIIGAGEVKAVYLKFDVRNSGQTQVFFKVEVESAISTSTSSGSGGEHSHAKKKKKSVLLLKASQLRFRNGCPVNVKLQAPSFGTRVEDVVVPGIILGICDVPIPVPVPDPVSPTNHGSETSYEYEYSIQILEENCHRRGGKPKILQNVKPERLRLREVVRGSIGSDGGDDDEEHHASGTNTSSSSRRQDIASNHVSDEKVVNGGGCGGDVRPSSDCIPRIKEEEPQEIIPIKEEEEEPSRPLHVLEQNHPTIPLILPEEPPKEEIMMNNHDINAPPPPSQSQSQPLNLNSNHRDDDDRDTTTSIRSKPLHEHVENVDSPTRTCNVLDDHMVVSHATTTTHDSNRHNIRRPTGGNVSLDSLDDQRRMSSMMRKKNVSPDQTSATRSTSKQRNRTIGSSSFTFPSTSTSTSMSTTTNNNKNDLTSLDITLEYGLRHKRKGDHHASLSFITSAAADANVKNKGRKKLKGRHHHYHESYEDDDYSSLSTSSQSHCQKENHGEGGVSCAAMGTCTDDLQGGGGVHWRYIPPGKSEGTTKRIGNKTYYWLKTCNGGKGMWSMHCNEAKATHVPSPTRTSALHLRRICIPAGFGDRDICRAIIGPRGTKHKQLLKQTRVKSLRMYDSSSEPYILIEDQNEDNIEAAVEIVLESLRKELNSSLRDVVISSR